MIREQHKKPKAMNSDIETEADKAEAGASPESLLAAGLRLLAWNELVRKGDFVADGYDGFTPWDGPPGFRADAFVKPTYRLGTTKPTQAAPQT